MLGDSALEEMMIPGRRVLVVNELGPVHKGDHLVIVAGVVVALDTSRRPEDVMLPVARPPVWPSEPSEPSDRVAAMSRRHYRKRKNMVGVTSKQVWGIIRDHQPVASVVISDKLGLERDDLPARSKVTRILKALIEERQIKRHQDDRVRVFRYELLDGTTEGTA
jgi:hypothetical protein